MLVLKRHSFRQTAFIQAGLRSTICTAVRQKPKRNASQDCGHNSSSSSIVTACSHSAKNGCQELTQMWPQFVEDVSCKPFLLRPWFANAFGPVLGTLNLPRSAPLLVIDLSIQQIKEQRGWFLLAVHVLRVERPVLIMSKLLMPNRF